MIGDTVVGEPNQAHHKEQLRNHSCKGLEEARGASSWSLDRGYARIASLTSVTARINEDGLAQPIPERRLR